jgi:hypothetical protein
MRPFNFDGGLEIPDSGAAVDLQTAAAFLDAAARRAHPEGRGLCVDFLRDIVFRDQTVQVTAGAGA